MVLDDLLRNDKFNSPQIIQVLIVSAVAFGFGYGVYIYCILLLVRERSSPYPVWMHTFCLACDVTGVLVLARQATRLVLVLRRQLDGDGHLGAV